MTLEGILKSRKSFSIVGASNELLKYGNELVRVFKDYGYKISPVSPKYNEIELIKCYFGIVYMQN